MDSQLSDNSLKASIIRFEGKFAVLETLDGQNVRWPIKELPDDAQEGMQVRLIISTAKSEQAAKESLSRAVINTLLSA